MSHPIDVGSVLGGRYKVTANVLTSHDQDLVLDGVDQVLNRPVSILVAGPGNADQVAQSAREVATGERPGHVQILDLGVSDSTTYLITNHSSAPDLLDLVVATHQPYVEPFFTDTLGSEIFGHARSHEPETYDGLYDEDEHEAEYITYDDSHVEDEPPAPAPARDPHRPVVPPMPPARPTSSPGIGSRLAAAAAGAGAAAAAAAAAVKGTGKSNAEDEQASSPAANASANAPTQASPRVPAEPASRQEPSNTAPQQIQDGPATQAVKASPVVPPSSRPAEQTHEAAANAGYGAPQESKVSLWSEEDYGFVNEEAAHSGATGGAVGGYSRNASNFPSTARTQADPLDEDEYYDEEPVREPKSFRWLVGGVLAAVLIVGLILAVTNLGNLIPGGAPAAKQTVAGPQTDSAPPSSTTSSAPVAAPPVIDTVTRLGNFDFAATYDKDLVKAYDGNTASYWSDMEFATPDWGGLAPDGVSLLVKLKSAAQVKSVTLNQLGASGGNISVYTSNQPSLDGAQLVGTNSFTSQELTMPLSTPVNAQYVIISIKALPKLTAPKTRYGYGLRLAEITVQ
ncbi:MULTISPECIES: ABC transporter substrate-binding protein [Arthrobacter]|uniref:ABC transporter substrate-binding protein n=1 Tax=Arthrobacter terricola TaxID=2547396 RepID=A0A4R5KRE4_9MICC|nr:MULTISPECIES: ABC transporter substrate-binding protein [Arthrobacter]MBT8160884.1 ABC transporter substrate-binding protein [Arthrobacter sp. GN70]TDF97360.1 ABC transporter substrate-binding protein [Arthrobacter terricola]